MRNETAPEPLVSMFANLSRDGIVVEYALFAPDSPTNPLDGIHRDAAESGLRLVEARLEAVIEARCRRSSPWGGRLPSDNSFFRVTHDIEKASAVEETLEVFLKDYWYAFSEPPHGPSVAETELRARFEEINRLLFDDLSSWSIMRWSSDWSNYFDEGLEWWGAFLWTLVSDDRKRAVWIGASSTD